MKELELPARYLKRQAVAFRILAQKAADLDSAAEYSNIADWYEHASVAAKPEKNAAKELHSSA